MLFPGAQAIRGLSIDLDNTLWDVLPTLVAAEEALKLWLQQHCPAVVPHYRPDTAQALRDELLERFPERAHDLTFLRQAVMKEIFVRAGVDPSLAGTAFDVFFKARNQVTFYDDVLPALDRLKQRFVLVALTDGNANLGLVGLDGYFDHYINARQVGAAKPAREMFAAVVDCTGLTAKEILHIGDDPVRDVVGAVDFGMRSVWVNRLERQWAHEDVCPDVQIDNLGTLVDGLLGSR